MGHTYTNLLTHIIFSTKDRLPYLRAERQRDVFTYIGGIVRELKGSAINVNGVADHIHILVRLPASLPVAKTVEIVNTNSSHPRIVGLAPNIRMADRLCCLQRERISGRRSVAVYPESGRASWEDHIPGGTNRVSPARAYSVRRRVSMEMSLPPLKGLDGSLSRQPRPSAVAQVLRRSAAGPTFSP
jgi:REP element-mobilizing transposase RayT